MKGVEASSIGYPQIGVPESHHIVSHHGNVPETMRKYGKINAYHLSLFADFVEKLRATPDGDGSLLDHSMVMYGSGMGNGDKHDQSRIPIMLAGSAAGSPEGRAAHCHSGSDARWRTSLPGSAKSRDSISASSRTPPESWSSKRGVSGCLCLRKLRLALSGALPERPAPKLGGKRERTRKKILEATFGLIGNENGLTVRIEEICAAAQISRGTFYNYFTSLEQLFEVLAIELSHELNLALVSTFDEARGHAEGSNAAIQHYLNHAWRDPAWGWAMVHLSAFGPTFGAESWDACYRSIAQGIEAGEFDVPNATVGRDLMTGTVLATVRTMLRFGSSESQPRIDRVPFAACARSAGRTREASRR